MIGKKVTDEKTLTLPEVKKILADRKKEAELTYEQKIALDYVKEFGKEGIKKAEKALKELQDLGIDRNIGARIINVKPSTKEEIMLIFEKVRFDVKEEQIKLILGIIEGLK